MCLKPIIRFRPLKANILLYLHQWRTVRPIINKNTCSSPDILYLQTMEYMVHLILYLYNWDEQKAGLRVSTVLLRKISIKSFGHFCPTMHLFDVLYIFFHQGPFSIIPAEWWRNTSEKKKKNGCMKASEYNNGAVRGLPFLQKHWHLPWNAWGDTRHNGFDKKPQQLRWTVDVTLLRDHL